MHTNTHPFAIASYSEWSVCMCTNEGGYGFLCSLRLMFTSFFCHLFCSNAIAPVTRALQLSVGAWWCWFRCLAIRFLVAFMCLLLFFAHFSAALFLQPNTLQSLSLSLSLTSVVVLTLPSMCAHSVASTRALSLHILLENWVQHDLFTIHKYVLWLQHTTDMIIFLCFLPLCSFSLR